MLLWSLNSPNVALINSDLEICLRSERKASWLRPLILSQGISLFWLLEYITEIILFPRVRAETSPPHAFGTSASAWPRIRAHLKRVSWSTCSAACLCPRRSLNNLFTNCYCGAAPPVGFSIRPRRPRSQFVLNCPIERVCKASERCPQAVTHTVHFWNKTVYRCLHSLGKRPTL